jgi:hypothetical protein
MVMPFESSLPVVLGCAAAFVAAIFAWLQFQRPWILVAAAILALAGIAAFVADRLVVTDRETLVELFPRLARAAEAQDLATIMAALDPELRGLREEAGRVLKEVRPKEIVITKTEIRLDPAARPPAAVADLIARVNGNVIDRGAPGTVAVAVTVTLHKKDGVWLIKDADAGTLTPGAAR